MKLIIFIPAYNEEEKIGEVVKKIPRKYQGIDQVEVLVVDDGSKDGTVKKAKEAGAVVISHYQNRGVGAAFQTGLNWAMKNKADILVNIDADGQFDSKDIEKLVKPIINNEADMVASNRFENGKPGNMPPLKYWGNKRMTNLINILAGTKFKDVSSGFRAYNREAMLNMNLFGQFTYTQEVFLDLSTKGLRIAQLPVAVKYFKSRKSKVAGNLIKYASKSFWIIFRTIRDYKPLKFFGTIGAICFIIGLFFDLFLAIHYISTGQFTPYISVGFIGAYLNTMGIGVVFLGLIADMFDRMRLNQEKILYYQKSHIYGDRNEKN